MKIYFEDGNKANNLKELLKLLCTGKCAYSKNLGGLATYFDKNLSKKQCDEGRYRSFDDLLLIAETYFPNIEPKDLFKEILLFKKDGQFLALSTCVDIKRVIVYCNSGHSRYDYIAETGSYDSEFSWLDLFSMLDINSQDDFQNFLRNNK